MKTIMVVDNELNILNEVKACLEEDNFQVVTVDNNREALELIEADDEDNYGLILINSSMPDTKIPAFFSMKPGIKKNKTRDKEKHRYKS
jgi:DNA-binding response OmpR family regulator